ncbi:MAG: VWA domain-containing protein [Pseudomonadota bacterium]
MNLHLRHSETDRAMSADAPRALVGLASDRRERIAEETPPLEQQWQDAQLALHLLTMQGGINGVRLKGRHSPARNIWLNQLESMATSHDIPVHRITSAAPIAQLTPSLDLAATLDAGRPVHTDGMIQRARGGILIVSGAERLSPEAAALLAQAVDDKHLVLIALDEAMDDEDTQMPAALAGRMVVTAKTDGLPLAVCGEAEFVTPGKSTQTCRSGQIGTELQTALATALEKLGQHSPRTLLHCCKVTKALAQFNGSSEAEAKHVHHALQLVLGITLTPPQEDSAEQPETPDPEAQTQQDPAPQSETPDDGGESTESASDDINVETAHGATLDPAILMAMASHLAQRQNGGAPRASSGAGAKRKNTRRGRPSGHSENPPYPDARPDILATLRSAAPWQKIRAKTAPAHMAGRVLIRSSDFRYKRLHQPRETVTIFIVDASGSTATQRLGDAKGAIERLLADCYVRRDNVALVAFRGREAETLLEPTRSLVRAKKGLSALPGGGATPLASGLEQGARMALRARREGQTPLMVLLSDGSANIGLDGEPSRAKAYTDALKVARQVQAHGLPCLFVDTARRPKPQTYELSTALGAELIPLPPSNAVGLDKIVANRLQQA